MPSGLYSCASDISPRPPAQYRVSTVAARIAYGKHFGNCQFFRGNGDLVENASATRARAPGARRSPLRASNAPLHKNERLPKG